MDCIVQLTGQLFANTQIPCSLWFLSKNRAGGDGYRKRTGEVLFIDGRKLGTLIPGSRKQKLLSSEELERVASAYREFRRQRIPKEISGFCRVAAVKEIRDHRYALTPGRYVGSQELHDLDEPFEDRFLRLGQDLLRDFDGSERLTSQIRTALTQAGLPPNVKQK